MFYHYRGDGSVIYKMRSEVDYFDSTGRYSPVFLLVVECDGFVRDG